MVKTKSSISGRSKTCQKGVAVDDANSTVLNADKFRT